MRTWLLPFLLCASCYQVKVVSGTFTCKEPGDRCPDGQLCSGGLCVNPGDERDLASAAEDLLSPPGADLRAEPDLRVTPDLSTGGDLGLDPCAAGWTEISPGKIFACRRTFNVTGGNFDNLCRAGHHVCNGNDDVSAAGTVGAAAKCSAVGSFFTTAIDIALRGVREAQRTADGICMPGAGDTSRALLGCGFSSGIYVLNGDRTCNGLNLAMRCSMALSGWTCTSAKEITQTSSQGGVLCCID